MVLELESDSYEESESEGMLNLSDSHDLGEGKGHKELTSSHHRQMTILRYIRNLRSLPLLLLTSVCFLSFIGIVTLFWNKQLDETILPEASVVVDAETVAIRPTSVDEMYGFYTSTVPGETYGNTGDPHNENDNNIIYEAYAEPSQKEPLRVQSKSADGKDDQIVSKDEPSNFTPDSMDPSSDMGTSSDSLSDIVVNQQSYRSKSADWLCRHADAVIERAMAAILEEYGQEPLDLHNTPWNKSFIPKMFAWDVVDLSTAMEPPETFQKSGNRGNGGWTSERSWRGLVFRLVQALQPTTTAQQNQQTKQEFQVVLGGHSAAAGHGNHFHQSYLMQFHKVMEPVFRQLGVKLTSRNLAQGGLGTVHSSLGFNSIYGSEIDLMLWDSSMTEGKHLDHIDLFFRQALMAEGRVPVVWGAGGQFDLLKMLHNVAEADIGEFGLGWDGVPDTMDEQQVVKLPWAVQHLRCSEERPDLCKDPYKFCSVCWLPRSDEIKPTQKQYDFPHGRVKWHPGWRSQQLQGRVLAFALLQALKDAVAMIKDDRKGSKGTNQGTAAVRNMTSYYDNIRRKVQSLDASLGHCYEVNGTLPERVCRTPMKGRTQYTPRSNAKETSLTSIIKAAPPNSYIPRNWKQPLYTGPDAHNSCFDIPPGAVDVVARITEGVNDTDSNHSGENERNLAIGTVVTKKTAKETTTWTDSPERAPTTTNAKLASGNFNAATAVGNSRSITTASTSITPGRGWELIDEPQGVCDGTYDTICAKSTKNRCVLSGHHDERGAVIGSAMAGWIVLEVPRSEIQSGIIIVKLHTWYDPQDNARTINWKYVNNVEPTGSHFLKGRNRGYRRFLDLNAHNRKRQLLALPNVQAMKLDATHASQETALVGHSRSRILKSYYKKRKLRRSRTFETPELREGFHFEYAIDGVITSLNNTDFLSRFVKLQEMVEVMTLLDDEGFANSSTATSSTSGGSNVVEVAIRLQGCLHNYVFGISHLYWA